jgi:hypothetical protein
MAPLLYHLPHPRSVAMHTSIFTLTPLQRPSSQSGQPRQGARLLRSSVSAQSAGSVSAGVRADAMAILRLSWSVPVS